MLRKEWAQEQSLSDGGGAGMSFVGPLSTIELVQPLSHPISIGRGYIIFIPFFFYDDYHILKTPGSTFS